MRAAERAAFARGVAVEALMDRAGEGVADTVERFFPKPGRCIAYVGKGHNGGDALVATRCLQRAGWEIELHLLFPESDCSELTRKELHQLKADPLPKLGSHPSRHKIILDGLLGIGAKPQLRDPILSAAREINRRRVEDNAFVFAIDVPTGLDSDSGALTPDQCVKADFTVTIGFAKHGLVADAPINFVGRLEVVPLGDLALPQIKAA